MCVSYDVFLIASLSVCPSVDQVVISSASHKCAWYLAAVRHSHQHTHTLMYGE